ncbi:hypothetical protein L7F22_050107 [Adiantum nelumboides]|nr:hypothetical protein [Adiantum nelumboides]MCO5596050.1 hypothetical protein [Adiantum nelumboides]
MASEDVKVITFWASPYGLRAEFALTAKGVPYERLLEVDHWYNKSKLLVESNPVHKQIPVLLHHGKPLPESFLIIEYVDDVWPSEDGKNLLPRDPYDRAMARFWCDFIEKKLNSALRSVLTTKGEVQKAAVEEALCCISTLEGVLEKASSSKEAPFFGGNHVGMVDCVLGPLSLWFPAYEIIGDFKFQLEEKYPRLHAWSQALSASPVAACIPDPHKLLEFVLGLRKMLCP